ncbi:MAG TPA: hypothetical protein PK961_10070 [bacterium]|nr:hypothetical protein [bacterium]
MKFLKAMLFGLLIMTMAMFFLAACDGDDDDDGDGGDDFDCQEAYAQTLANQCLEYGTFEFYACSPEEDLTDPACFRGCIAELTDGADLCYETERCEIQCSDDDATGCENAYYGMSNVECLEYKDFFNLACDPRLDTAERACASFCYENEEGCDAFAACLENC